MRFLSISQQPFNSFLQSLLCCHSLCLHTEAHSAEARAGQKRAVAAGQIQLHAPLVVSLNRNEPVLCALADEVCEALIDKLRGFELAALSAVRGCEEFT